jgi:hypothetical protein
VKACIWRRVYKVESVEVAFMKSDNVAYQWSMSMRRICILKTAYAS